VIKLFLTRKLIVFRKSLNPEFEAIPTRLQIWKSNVLADFQQSIAKKVARNLLKNVGSLGFEPRIANAPGWYPKPS
jgi:hypothetical protein